MGEIIEIREELDSHTFRIGFTVTGEERIVSVDSDKIHLFRSAELTASRPMACPFLRETGTEKCVCSVHTTRPGLCRQYSCYRLLVLDSGSNRIGKVTDASRYFTTNDPNLRRLWNQKIAEAEIADEMTWEIFVEETLVRAGYRVVR
jgi:Fe-S-cluster containining protein